MVLAPVYTDVFDANSGGFSSSAGETYLVTGGSTTIAGVITINGGTVTITNGATVNEKIELNGGTLIIEDGATVTGDVLAKSGTNSLTITDAIIAGIYQREVRGAGLPGDVCDAG